MRKRAQTTLEYAVIFAVIAAALITMSVYMKRGIQGRLRSNIEQLNEGAFYSPGITNGTITTRTKSTERSDAHNIPFNLTNNETGSDTITNTNSLIHIETEREEEVEPFRKEPKR
ncbi:MAG: hypothetical protein WC628_00770 [Candidatus Omnitrophota bacterium]